MIGNCRDCRHWDPTKNSYPGYVVVGSCERMAECTGNPDPNEPAWIDAPAGSDGLKTRADFGCVLFERNQEVAP